MYTAETSPFPDMRILLGPTLSMPRSGHICYDNTELLMAHVVPFVFYAFDGANRGFQTIEVTLTAMQDVEELVESGPGTDAPAERAFRRATARLAHLTTILRAETDHIQRLEDSGACSTVDTTVRAQSVAPVWLVFAKKINSEVLSLEDEAYQSEQRTVLRNSEEDMFPIDGHPQYSRMTAIDSQFSGIQNEPKVGAALAVFG